MVEQVADWDDCIPEVNTGEPSKSKLAKISSREELLEDHTSLVAFLKLHPTCAAFG
jgi:hypothetical protein